MPPGKRAFSSDPALTMTTEPNNQTTSNDVPSASDVPAAAEGQGQQQEQRRGGGGGGVAVTVAAVAVTVAVVKSVIPNGKSALCRSEGSLKPLKAAKR